MSESTSRKLSYLQFVCSLFIMGLHLVFPRHFDPAPAWAAWLNTAFRTLFDVATSTFFALSAVLFFRKADQKRYGSVLLDKLRTLVVPLLLWNALYLLHATIRQYLSLGYWPTYTPGEWLRYLTIEPANSVFWFVDVLILFTLLYPLILWGLRKKWPAWCAYGIAIGLNLIPTIGIPYASVLFWLPCYLMGAYIGYHYDALFQRTPTVPRKQLYLLAALCLAALGGLGGLNRSAYYLYWQLAPIPVWILADVFTRLPAPRWWINASFYLFASHLLFEHYAVKLYQKALGTGVLSFVAANVLLPCLCAVLALICIAPIHALLPKVYGFVTGWRPAVRRFQSKPVE